MTKPQLTTDYLIVIVDRFECKNHIWTYDNYDEAFGDAIDLAEAEVTVVIQKRKRWYIKGDDGSAELYDDQRQIIDAWGDTDRLVAAACMPDDDQTKE
jgi:hypothetical protein